MVRGSADAARPATPLLQVRRAVRIRTHRPTGDAGSSLLEVLIAVFLVSMVVLGLATAFISLMRINRANAEQQRVDHAVDNVAEQLKAVPYVDTGDRLAAYRAQVPPAAAGEPTVTLTLVECRVRGAAAADDLYDPACAADTGTQRVTIRGEYLDRSRNAQVVVRDR
jgi:Tfp pilus assembly protein PilV